MQSFRDVRDQGMAPSFFRARRGTDLAVPIDTLRQLLRGWNQAAKSSAIRRQASAVVVELVKDNLLQVAMRQWQYRARALILDPKAGRIQRCIPQDRCANSASYLSGGRVPSTSRRRIGIRSPFSLESEEFG